MTANQLIALLFPVAGAAGAMATGLLAKWIWVDRPRARESRFAAEARSASAASRPSPDAMVAARAADAEKAALTAIAEAERNLQRAHQELERRGLR
jgi:hypothetical protein